MSPKARTSSFSGLCPDFFCPFLCWYSWVSDNMSKPAWSPVSKCSTSYPRRLKRASSAWHEMGGVGWDGGNRFSLFRSAVGLHPDALSKLRTVWLPAPLAYSGTSSCHLTATFLLGRRRGCSCGHLCIGASLLDVRSIVCIEIGSARLSLLPVRTRTGLTMLL